MGQGFPLRPWISFFLSSTASFSFSSSSGERDSGLTTFFSLSSSSLTSSSSLVSCSELRCNRNVFLNVFAPFLCAWHKLMVLICFRQWEQDDNLPHLDYFLVLLLLLLLCFLFHCMFAPTLFFLFFFGTSMYLFSLGISIFS